MHLRLSALEFAHSVIDAKTGRGLVKRVLQAPNDVQDVEKAFRFVAALIEEFQVHIYIYISLSITEAAFILGASLHGVQQQQNKPWGIRGQNLLRLVWT